MAGGADGGQRLAPLWDVTRWAASFMARLFNGAATPIQPPAEEAISGGGGCNSLYRSVSTEEDDGDTGRWGSELDADADESDQEQLLATDDGEDPRRARSVCCERGPSRGSVHTMSSSKAHELKRRHSTGAAPRSGNAAMEAAESEPLMLRRRRRAAKLANDVETVDHPFGRGRREEESSSSLLLLSS